MRIATVLLIVLGFLPDASAHEVDHYILPVGARFADLGPHLTETTYERIVRAVAKLNERLARAGNSEKERLRSPDALAQAVCNEFPSPIDYIQGLERHFHDPDFTARFAGLIVAHRSSPCVYDGAQLPVEPRAFFLLWRSSLIRANGVFLGTDKLGHFVHNGYNYYVVYREARREGQGEDAAMRAAMQVGVDGNFFFAERGLLGTYTSTVISNADLASNYAGLLFYRNLTDDIRIGSTLLPRLADCNDRWRLAPHVRPDGDFLCRLITDHWDELLNPNIYEQRMHDAVYACLPEQCARIRAWYSDQNGNPRTAEWFTRQREVLRTFFGADYGFISDAPSGFITIDAECFKSGQHTDPQPPPTTDPLRRTELMRAMRAAESASVNTSRGDVAARDIDGETALHHAARCGDAALIRGLLSAGASSDAADRYGNRPLHLAARRASADIMDALLNAGAPVDAPNQFGQTAAHLAAQAANPACIAELIAHRANLNALDASGNTPLHLAARAGRRDVALKLIQAGADASLANRLRRTPAQEARAAGFDSIQAVFAAAEARPSRPPTAGLAEPSK